MTALQAFLADLRTPEDFRGQPFRAFANAAAKMGMGAVVFAFACLAWSAITGALPYRLPVALALVVVYFLIFEVALQRLRKGWPDALADTGFLAYGVAMVALTVTEIAAHGLAFSVAVAGGLLAPLILGGAAIAFLYGLSRG